LMGLGYGYGLKNGKDIGAWLNKILDFFVTLFKPGKRLKVTYKKPKTDSDFRKAKTDYDYNKVKEERQKAIDHILDKISKGGYDSLTREEKDILFRESQKKH
ncbi:MAG: rhomboid family intramembrane serine protease, partial [Bacteroidales bacterium]|nr:rhomboid family intramembrane serine protease [Bacteroidales bacterium]